MFPALMVAISLFAQSAASVQPAAPSVEEGLVTVTLNISESGSVEKCTVTETNAPQDFADKICSIFVATAKFEPKRDAQGVAGKTSMTQTVRFELQD